MSRKGLDPPSARRRNLAPLFAALGDETRLSLIARLSAGRPASIARLSDGTRLTRQAVAKHVRVLEKAGLVRRVRSGRESLCEFDPGPVGDIRDYLASVSEQWDRALDRLKGFVEGDP